ncbi:MAG: hypothetical protein KDK07_05605 [Bauldia sp.]|nr:hypothetical protein [Bauldia sp.]
MRVGILDLLSDTMQSLVGRKGYGRYVRKQFMSIMPQAVAVWCRELGHEVHYATFWGQRDPMDLVPPELDVVFISAYTQCSALAYALSIAFKRHGTLTVIGGPHARSFPTDASRFFDIVVGDCDRTLIDDILHRRIDPPAVVNAGHPLHDFPSVEERMPEIRVASYENGRPISTSIVPILSSVGCPYSCNFCVDWNSDYRAFPASRLRNDLEYLSRNHPNLIVVYHDPNFAIRFDETMDVITSLPVERRNRYMMESSLSVLKDHRIERLSATNCIYIAPGIESWGDYSRKAGTGSSTGRDKLNKVIQKMNILSDHVPGIMANFVFGTDADDGDEPAALTHEFIERLPEIWPNIQIPTPFGGSPLYDELMQSGRIISEMPFSFYFTPYLAIVLQNYDPISYYDYLIKLNEIASSKKMAVRRLGTRQPLVMKFVNLLRTFATRRDIQDFRTIRDLLVTDRAFLAFHEGRTNTLPEYYAHNYRRRLGRFAELLPPSASTPILEQPATTSAPTVLPISRRTVSGSNPTLVQASRRQSRLT